MRLPNTLNHKYLDGPHQVQVVNASFKTLTPDQFEMLPDTTAIDLEEADDNWLAGVNSIHVETGPQQLLASLQGKLGARVVQQYNVQTKDRSAALWGLMCSAFRAGCTRDQVFWLAKHSANNKFAQLRYSADRELGKDVLRAEVATRTVVPDSRTLVIQARKLQGGSIEKKQQVFKIVLSCLRSEGEFIRTSEDSCWYIRRDLGRPISIAGRSEYLDMLLDTRYALNSSEIDHTYVTAGLVSFGKTLPITGALAALSYYDLTSNTVLLHSGRKDVFSINADSISKVTDGSYGVVFPWPTGTESVSLQGSLGNETWWDALFGSQLSNVLGFEREEASALLRVWMLFLLFRASAVSRPILSLLGQPGAGKSTLFRRVYALLYGRHRSLNAVTSPDDFDHAVSNDPLVVLDNVDTWERWLPDRLALSSSTSDIVKRKLYTDVDTVVLKRQALVGLTAHSPKFGREDVADRLLVLSFERLKHFDPEGDLIESVLRKRNAIWAAIARDVQQVLRTKQPPVHEAPQFRIEDFARVGHWIATALGIQQHFVSALARVQSGQRGFALEDEHLLVGALRAVISQIHRQGKAATWYSSTALWQLLEAHSEDGVAFSKIYRNSARLGKKLWSLHEALSSQFMIESRFNSAQGARFWRFPQPINGTTTPTQVDESESDATRRVVNSQS